MTKPVLHLIQLIDVPIFKQLQLEEALLRSDQRNFCLMNSGSEAAIVMGISGNPDKLIHKNLMEQHKVPLIKRFSGGGTVFINEETLFVTFIFEEKALNIPIYPQNIFKWSETVYQPVFEHCDFTLQENDYCSGIKKFGGNAQYLRKNRWLHHTSLLFDYDEAQMSTLKFPEKVPHYRNQRSHTDFLCKLKDFFPSKEIIKEKIETSLQNQFHVQELHLHDIETLLDQPHRKATTLISSQNGV